MAIQVFHLPELSGLKTFSYSVSSTAGFSRASSLKAVSGRSRLVMKSSDKSLILLSFLGYKLFLFRIINCWFHKSFLIKSCLRKIKVGNGEYDKSLILQSFLGSKLILFRIKNCWFLKRFLIKSCLRNIKVGYELSGLHTFLPQNDQLLVS